MCTLTYGTLANKSMENKTIIFDEFIPFYGAAMLNILVLDIE